MSSFYIPWKHQQIFLALTLARDKFVNERYPFVDLNSSVANEKSRRWLLSQKNINKFKDNLRKSKGKIHLYLGKITDAIKDFTIIHNFWESKTSKDSIRIFDQYFYRASLYTLPQLAITCSKLTIEWLEQGIKYV